jgi:PAS domain S-box-containing protein
VGKTQSVVTIEYTLPVGGKDQMLEGRLAPLPNGEILLLVRNITRRKRTEQALAESEKRYRVLVESMNEGMGVMDEHLAITYVNARYCQMLGYSKEEVEGHLNENHFYDEESRRRFLAMSADRGRGIPASYELILRKKTGEPVPVLVSEQPLLDERGTYRGSIGIITDITELKRAEEQLNALSLQLLKAQDEERQQIAHELHDEFGQLLAVASMGAKRLCARIPNDQQDLREAADQLVGDVDRAIQTMRTMQKGLHPTVLDHLGLDAAIDLLVSEYQERTGIACNLDMEGAPFLLDAERARAVYRIIQEALTNVARHADAAEVDITVHHNGSGLRLEIADDGRGIEAGKAVAPTSYGLMGMRKRAELCGGQMEIRARSGGGTVIAVRVPLERSEQHG